MAENTPATSAELPVVYVSHGSPMLAVEDVEPSRFLKKLGTKLRSLTPEVRAVVVLSAHWETEGVVKVNTSAKPEIIYDFYGFPDELYKVKYPVKGSPELSTRVLDLLTSAGLKAAPDSKHGIDHGAWVPLRYLFPSPSAIPVVQVSLLEGGTMEQHVKLGEALRPLRKEGVLILCSGSAVHNLTEIGKYFQTTEIAPYVKEFDDELISAVTTEKISNRVETMTALKNHPLLKKAHPSLEHLLPVYCAAGAAENEKGYLIFDYLQWTLSYAAFSFGQNLE